MSPACFAPRSAARRRWCAWCITASAKRNLRRSCRVPTRPTSSASANCARSKPSTFSIEALSLLKVSGRPRHRHHCRRRAARPRTQGAGGAFRHRRSGALRRASPGARSLRHGPHAGHSLTRRIAALRGAGSDRRRTADHLHARRRHPGNLRTGGGKPDRRRRCRRAGRRPSALRSMRRPTSNASRKRCKSRVHQEFSLAAMVGWRPRRLSRGDRHTKTCAVRLSLFLHFIYYLGAHFAAAGFPAPTLRAAKVRPPCPSPNPTRSSTPLQRSARQRRRCRTPPPSRKLSRAFALRAGAGQ